MSTAPKVSVIIPSYNGEQFIAEAVSSILGQTWRDLELIVVDDGSTDGTRAILRELAAGDGRMRVIEKPNEGLIATLNLAIAEVRGVYVARLDHDDVARPNRIERQAGFLDEHPEYVAVGCLMQNMRADGSYVGTVRIRHEKLVHRPDAFPPAQTWLYGPSPMVRTKMLREAGGYRPQFLAAEDRDLCWRLGALGPVERLPEVLVDYRYHDSNMSKVRRRTQRYSELLSDLSAIAKHFEIDDSDLLAKVDVGGDYGPALDGYRRLLANRYPVETYILLFQLRTELWDVPGNPDRARILAAVLRHLAARPVDPLRWFLLRRSILYLVRQPRASAQYAIAQG